jgi:hypothetical protein
MSDPTLLYLTGINNAGKITGTWYQQGGPELKGAVVIDLATAASIDVPPPKDATFPNTYAGMSLDKIDTAGTITGQAISFDLDVWNRVKHYRSGPVIRNVSGMKWFELSGLKMLNIVSNVKGDIAGTYESQDGAFHAFYRKNAKNPKLETLTPFGQIRAKVVDINDRGDVLGMVYDGVPHASGFLRRDGVYTLVDFPGAFETHVYGMNNRGDVVGKYVNEPSFDGQIYHYAAFGFTWMDGVYAHVDLGYSTVNGYSTELHDINDSRQIVGSAEDGAISFAILPPATTTISEAK